MIPSRAVGVRTLALAAALASGACALVDSGALPPCPDVSILAGSERLVLFRPGPGRDLIDVVVEADMSNLRASCDYDEGSVDVEASFEIVSTRGPEAGTGTAAIPFFAAVVGPDERVVAKKTFESRAEFPAGHRRVAVQEILGQRIPLSRREAGPDYRVLVGFQLTPEQLEHNRSRR